jgi:TolB-like protein
MMSTRIGMKDDGVPSTDAQRALERVLASRAFANSTRLSHFLRYTVEETLEGNSSVLKEYTIGVSAYGRKSDFDPSHDTIVRTEARRLRRKLTEYYEGEGKDDDVVIFFRSGSYVPVIHWRNAVQGEEPAATQPEELTASKLWKRGDGVWVRVAPFSTSNGDSFAASCAFGLAEEILHRLTSVQGVRVVVADLVNSSMPRQSDTPDQAANPEIHIVIGGAVRCDHNRLRVTIRLATASGLLLWSQRFDASLEHAALADLQDEIAATLLSRIAPRETFVRRFAGTPTEALYKLYSEVLVAESLIEESSQTSLTKALSKLEELKLKAPDYVRLDCGIAQCCVGLAQRGGYPPDALADRASVIARELIAKSPDMPEAHSILGIALAQEWKWKAAEQSFRTAISLGSQHSIHRHFAIVLLLLGRTDESWEHLEIAQEMDPLSVRQKVSMGRFFYYSRRHRDAIEYYRKPKQLSELPFEPSYYQALTMIQLGRIDEALALAERLQRRSGPVVAYQAVAAELYALCGEIDHAAALVEERNLLLESSPYSSFRKAKLAIALNEISDAISFLKHSFACKEPELPFLAIDPRFDDLRDHKIVRDVTSAIFQAKTPA